MPYIVNETSDSLRLPGLGRVLPAGGRSDQILNPVTLTPEQATEFAGNPNLAVFDDDGTPIAPPAADWSPKKIDLSWMDPPATVVTVPQRAPEQTEQAALTVPAREHIDIIPDSQEGR